MLTCALVKLAWVRDTGPAVRDADAGLAYSKTHVRVGPVVLSVTTHASVIVRESVVTGPAMSLLVRGSGLLGPAEPPGDVGPATSDLTSLQACVGP